MENLLKNGAWPESLPSSKLHAGAQFTTGLHNTCQPVQHLCPATPCQPQWASPREARNRTRLYQTSSVPRDAPPPAEAESARGIQRTEHGTCTQSPAARRWATHRDCGRCLISVTLRGYFPGLQKSLPARPRGCWTMGSLCSWLKCNPRGHKSSTALTVTHFAATFWVRSILESLDKDNKENGLTTCSQAPLWLCAGQQGCVYTAKSWLNMHGTRKGKDTSWTFENQLLHLFLKEVVGKAAGICSSPAQLN